MDPVSLAHDLSPDRSLETSFRQLAESLPQLVWIARADGTIVYVNQQTIEYTGLGLNDLAAHGWSSIVHPDDEERYRQELRRSLQTEVPYQIEYRLREAASGQYRWFLGRAVPLRDEHGRVTQWFGTCSDIDEQKQVQESRRLSEQRFRALSASSPIGIFMTDDQGNLTYANPMCQAIAGFTLEEAEGMGWARWIYEEDAEWVLTRWFLALEERHEFREEFRWSTSRGIRWGVLQASPMRNEHGEFLGSVCTLRDTTAERATSDALEHARDEAEASSRAKDYFLAILSHELRTPLTPILAQAQLMASDESLTAMHREQAEVILRNAELEVLLIDDLLDLTRIRNGKLRMHAVSVDINHVVRQALQVAQSDELASTQKFVTEFHASPATVKADQARLQQVFWNLIKNSIKFSPPDSTVTIATATEDNHVVISVTDEGIGLEAQDIERIFRPFEQVGREEMRMASGGLGLGLAIASSIVELHGGTLKAFSEGRTKGSTFTVRLPLSIPVEAAAPTEAAPSTAAPRAKHHILLVDDHGDTGKVFQMLLQRQGYAVTVATNVRGALRAAEEDEFDLLVSDIGLPDGTGLDLMTELSATKRLRGIALSGFGTPEDIARSKEAGFTEHLTKPISFPLLKAAVERVLAENGIAKEH